MEIFMVWHVHHAESLDGSPTGHADEDGQVPCDEQSGDDAKVLGLYGTKAEAEKRIRAARQQPGFRDEPDCFITDPYTLGEDHWTEGFVTIPPRRSEPPRTGLGTNRRG